jgi:hypothetical protein
MGQSYYAQSDNPGQTMTVGQLIDRLLQEDSTSLVVFQSPSIGVFGPDTMYSIEEVTFVNLPRREYNRGKQEHYNENTNETTYSEEDYIQVFNAWKGVVIK